MIPSAPPKDQRRRGADHPRSSPSPGRRRGCNCKKSGCLKLYCECFAANIRCGDRCQCMGCKNQEHNKLEIAHALEAIEKRTQRSSKSPIAVARKLETLRTSTPQSQHQHHASTPGQTPIRSAMDGATRLLMSAERLEEGTPYKIAMRADSDCVCQPGVCYPSSSCREKYGGCGPRCLCQQTPAVEKTRVPQSHEKTRGCSCKKSNCLKLYCECLAAQRVCDSRCNCEGCKNHSGHHEERERAISVILERNPMAFQPKVATGASQHLRGCNCRKSNCMKNYCECHQAGVPCTSRCACQGCRNTDAFVSAKKMLIFSGDLKANSNSTSPDGSVHSHHHATTPAIGSSKPPRRPARRASMDITSPHMQFRTPTSQPPTGLDMLSRTAPPASQQQHAQYNVGTSNVTTPIVTKRKLSDLMVPQDERSFGFSSEHRKKSGKHSSSRSSFQERLERAAVPNSPELPSVESALDAELNASKLELPLSKLCRSLLNAAKSVDVVPTPRKTDRSPLVSRIAPSPGLKGNEFKADEPENELAVASPPADDLLCEEDIETPTRPPTASTTDESGKEEDREAKRRAADLRLAAMQERAVLQEFSVWLRNLTTSAASTTFPAPSQ